MAKKQPTTISIAPSCSCSRTPGNDSGGFIYFLGVIGAAVYYIQQATGFWNGALGLLKALVWPAMLVYHALGL